MCYDDRIIIESKGKIYKLEVGFWKLRKECILLEMSVG